MNINEKIVNSIEEKCVRIVNSRKMTLCCHPKYKTALALHTQARDGEKPDTMTSNLVNFAITD